jgi:hypothetical protein
MSTQLALYHHTSREAAVAIQATGMFTSREVRSGRHEVCFTNRRGGMAAGFGSSVVLVRIPEDCARLDDEFPDGEQHYRVYADEIRPHWICGVNLGCD